MSGSRLKGHMPIEGAIIEAISVGSLSELQGLPVGARATSEPTAEAPPGSTVRHYFGGLLESDCLNQCQNYFTSQCMVQVAPWGIVVELRSAGLESSTEGPIRRPSWRRSPSMLVVSVSTRHLRVSDLCHLIFGPSQCL